MCMYTFSAFFSYLVLCPVSCMARSSKVPSSTGQWLNSSSVVISFTTISLPHDDIAITVYRFLPANHVIFALTFDNKYRHVTHFVFQYSQGRLINHSICYNFILSSSLRTHTLFILRDSGFSNITLHYIIFIFNDRVYAASTPNRLEVSEPHIKELYETGCIILQ